MEELVLWGAVKVGVYILVNDGGEGRSFAFLLFLLSFSPPTSLSLSCGLVAVS